MKIASVNPNMKLHLLIADNTPLYPPTWGGPKRVWNLYSNFSQNLFDITYVGLNLSGSFSKIRDNFKEILTGFPLHYYPWYIFKKIALKNTFPDLFVYLYMHTNQKFKHIINSRNADIIIYSHPWASLCITKKNRQLFIYDAHNCEYLLMKQLLKNNPLNKIILNRIKKIEEEACKKSDLILACSEKQKDDFINLYKSPDKKILIIPNGSNINKEHNKKNKDDCRKKLSILPKEKTILFIGSYYKPNIDAVKFIIKKASFTQNEFKFLIAGAVSEFFTAKKLPPNIVFLGSLSEQGLSDALTAADIAINPVFNGSGTNIKMLDYMSYGLPVITTECGARGIKTYGKNPMIICEDFEFVNNIKMLFRNNLLYKQMSEDGKALIAERYNWPLISSILENNILNALAHAE